jgi:hypothetical protein
MLKLQTLQTSGRDRTVTSPAWPKNSCKFRGQTDLALSREFHGRAFRESGSPAVCPASFVLHHSASLEESIWAITNFAGKLLQQTPHYFGAAAWIRGIGIMSPYLSPIFPLIPVPLSPGLLRRPESPNSERSGCCCPQGAALSLSVLPSQGPGLPVLVSVTANKQ